MYILQQIERYQELKRTSLPRKTNGEYYHKVGDKPIVKTCPRELELIQSKDNLVEGEE